MKAAGDARVKAHVIEHRSFEVVSCYILVVRVRSVLRLKGAKMEKEANILKCVLATEPLLVRIDRSAYAPQMRRIADLQSWLVGPGVPYITVYREGGSKSQPPTLRPPRTCFWYSHVVEGFEWA